MAHRAPAVRLRLTRLGWQFAFIGVFAMLGGAIRSYNLPLLLAGLLVGTLLLQWRWARATLLVVSTQRRLPSEAFAGEPFSVRFLVANESRWLPAWLLRLDDLIRPHGQPQGWVEHWRSGPSKSIKASCGVGVVPGGRTLTARYECVITRRGRYDVGPARLSTGFPLGLMIAERTERQRDNLYVFPRRLTLKRNWQRELQSRVGGNATTARRSGVQEGEFFGIRGWQAGDSRRWIHWRTTARIGEPAVRQYEQQRRFELCILVDAYRGPPPVADAKEDHQAADEALETVISAAATLVTALVATPTNKIGLAIAGDHVTALTSGGGRDHTVAMLRQLTELAGTPEPDLIGAIQQMIRTSGTPRDLLILSPRPMVAGSEKLIAMIGHRSMWQWRSVADGSIERIIERSPAATNAVESKVPPLVTPARDETSNGSNYAARSESRL